MPFCAAVRMAVAVVLARCSAPERVRSIADSGAVGGTHGTGCRARFSMFSGRPGGLRACSCCVRPERHFEGSRSGPLPRPTPPSPTSRARLNHATHCYEESDCPQCDKKPAESGYQWNPGIQVDKNESD